MVVDIEMVLDKKRGQDNDLISRIEQGLEDHIQAASRPAGHEHITQLQVNLLFPPEPLG